MKVFKMRSNIYVSIIFYAPGSTKTVEAHLHTYKSICEHLNLSLLALLSTCSNRTLSFYGSIVLVACRVLLS